MLEERELISAILAIAVLLFVVRNRGKLGRIPHPRLLVLTFVTLAISLACTVIEVLHWEAVFNFLQHTFAAASMVFLAIWTWFAFARREGAPA